LSFLLKTLVSVSIRRSFGRQFHSAGPEKEKARSANFVRSLGFWHTSGTAIYTYMKISWISIPIPIILPTLDRRRCNIQRKYFTVLETNTDTQAILQHYAQITDVRQTYDEWTVQS